MNPRRHCRAGPARGPWPDELLVSGEDARSRAARPRRRARRARARAAARRAALLAVRDRAAESLVAEAAARAAVHGSRQARVDGARALSRVPPAPRMELARPPRRPLRDARRGGGERKGTAL